MTLTQLKGGNAEMEKQDVNVEGKLEQVMSDLKPRVEIGASIKKEELLAQRPYELSSSPDYTDLG